MLDPAAAEVNERVCFVRRSGSAARGSPRSAETSVTPARPVAMVGVVMQNHATGQSLAVGLATVLGVKHAETQRRNTAAGRGACGTCSGRRRLSWGWTRGERQRAGRPARAASAPRRAHRPGEGAGTRYAVRRPPGRRARAPDSRFRQGHVLGRVHHRPRSRLRRRERRVLHRPLPGARTSGETGDRSRRQGGARDAAEWPDTDRQVPRQPGMRHPSGRPAHGGLHAGPGEEHAAGPDNPAVAHG